MQAIPNQVDSEVLGATVLDISDWDPDADFRAFESQYGREHKPHYVVCKVPADSLRSIHSLEEHGFRFVEFQIRLTGTTARSHDTSLYPYRYQRVEREADLEPVLAITASTFEHDRYSRDPMLRNERAGAVSGQRYCEYVRRSFRAPGDCVFRLVSSISGETVGFGTHRHVDSENALLLLGGVRPDLKRTGVGAINDLFALNELKREGVKRFVTHVAGVNYPIMNLEIRTLGFRVVASYAVMRKVYV